MFALGLVLEGRLFPFELSQPLVALAAAADLGWGFRNLIARTFGYGSGNVVAVTYEDGSTSLVVAGLRNFLVILDAYDVALGRK